MFCHDLQINQDSKIFNPADGGAYASKAKLNADGKILEVTGKWMFFSKQQQWQRVVK